MTFEELLVVLKTENISPAQYDVLGCGYVGGEDGFIIENALGGYNVCYIERGNKTVLTWVADEHSACIKLIQEFIDCGEYQLQKYLERAY